MRGLVFIITIVCGLQMAWAGGRHGSSVLTDTALMVDLQSLADEINTHSHDQKTLNRVYTRLLIVRKISNPSINHLPRLNDAEDEDILMILDDIADQLENRNHRRFIRFLIKKFLKRSFLLLENNREQSINKAFLTANVTSFDFGAVGVGATRNVNIIITNDGVGTATVTGESGLAAPFFFGGKATYPGLGGSCGTTIEPEENCVISLEFNPTVPSTTFSGSIQLDYNDGSEVQSVSTTLQGSTF